MLSIRSKLFKNRKGFTLIELIVVIAILAILAVLAVPRFLGTLEDARIRTHNANIKTLQSAAMIALAENGNPTGAVVWNATTSTVGGTATTTNGAFHKDDYIQEWPTNPITSGAAAGAYSVGISTTGVVTISQVTATP